MATADRNANSVRQGSIGSIFDAESIVCHGALSDLAVVMKQVGFLVDKKRDNESTLRVYVRERLTYPLLNPRFCRGPIRGLVGRAFLEIAVLSKGHEWLDSRLGSFPASSQVLFKALGSLESGYLTHGHFYLPLEYSGKGRARELNVPALGPGLTEIIRFLE